MLISSNTTFPMGVLHKPYLKKQIEVPWILLTTKTNLGKFTVVLPFSSQSLGQTLRIFCHVVVYYTFFVKDANF